MISIVNVRCEHMMYPLSVTVQNPRFSWNLQTDEKNIYQKAYQIIVENENGEISWDSGRQESSVTVEIAYQGKRLASASRYRYQITVWDMDERIAQSEYTWFETAFYHISDWKAGWIEPDPLPQLPENPLLTAQQKWMESITALMRGESVDMISEGELLPSLPLEPYDPAVRMRREFEVNKAIKRARLYITAHGIYDVKINGSAVTDALLTPGFTTYNKRIKYQVYNVDSFVNQGDNAIGVTVADGWYKGKIALGRGCEYGEVPGLLMQLELTYEDGSKNLVCSDSHWKYSFDGSVRAADLFLGETYDARLDDGDHSVCGYESIAWKPVHVKGGADDTLEAQIEPFVKVFAEIPAKRVWTSSNGDTLVDFGQNMAGFIRVTVRNGEKGEQITFEHGEVLDKAGNYTYAFEGTNREQKDTYICKGAETEVFEPRFTYHGFRYVRVKGGRNWDAAQFTAMAISTDNQVTGKFSCSDEKLNQLQHNITWSQRTNNISIPTDCPTREKAGWTGDVVVYGPTAVFNQDMTAFYEDWLSSIRAEQTENGHVLNTVPQIKNYVQQSMAGSLGWGDVILTLPWLLYERCGNARVLEDNYEAMGKWMAAMRKAADELPQGYNMLGADTPDISSMSGRQLENQHYLINSGFHFGDWLVPSVKNEQGLSDPVKSSFLTMNYVDTSLLASIADLYAKVSEKLGHAENAEEHYQYANRVREAFYEEYVDKDGKIAQDMQGNYILALVHNMVPDDKKPLLAGHLNRLVKENGNCLDTGFMSVAYILDVLCDYGYTETAWKVLKQNKCPSWLYEIERGATTIWENWDAIAEDGTVTGCSFNHYAFGCVGDFMFRRLLGIQNAGIGFDKINISPEYTLSDMDWAEGSYLSGNGKIQVRWERKSNGGFEISGCIPANTSAVLTLPDGSKSELGNGVFKVFA